jgi:glycosyltransferase involved in cell wall biosynthesis
MMVVEATAGGTWRHVLDIAAGCHRRGIAVHLVCAVRREPASRSAMAALRGRGVDVIEIDMRREIHPLQDAAAVTHLRELIASIAPDVLHLHSSKAGALGRVAVAGLRRARPYVVYTPHAYAFLTQPGGLVRRLCWCAERALLRWTDCVVAVSGSEARAASRLGGSTHVVTIPNGVESPRRVAPASRAAGTTLRIGWLGRLVWQKNPQAAITTSAALSARGVRHELQLGGDGPYGSAVVSLARRLRCDSVVVRGFVEDTDTFHAGIDALLVTSRSEGLPYVGLDTMAHGRPIVGFDVPGIRDLVEHGVTGLLAPAGDVDALASHLQRLARDPELRLTLGAAARTRVRRDFPFDRQLRALCRLYQSHGIESAAESAAS